MNRRLAQLISVVLLLAALAFLAGLLVMYWDLGRRPVPPRLGHIADGALLVATAVAGAFLTFSLVKRLGFDARLCGLEDAGIRWKRRWRVRSEPFSTLTNVDLQSGLFGEILVVTRRDGSRLRLHAADGAASFARILPCVVKPRR